MLLWASAVGRHVGVLRGLKIGPPPVCYHLLQKQDSEWGGGGGGGITGLEQEGRYYKVSCSNMEQDS